jgi:hypothetical protein
LGRGEKSLVSRAVRLEVLESLKSLKPKGHNSSECSLCRATDEGSLERLTEILIASR